MRIRPVPTKTVPDWQALAEIVRTHGAQHIPADICLAVGRAALHRKGLGIYPVKKGEKIIAHVVEKLR